MKKTLKILGKILALLILLFLLALFLVPVLFKGRIMEIARTEMNNSVNATVDFTDLSVSLIRHFPYLSVGMDGLSVVGKDDFAGDTLMRFSTFTVSVNPFGLIGNKGIEIRQILLDRPVIHAVVLPDGRANWDIVPEDTTGIEETPDTTASEMPAVTVQLKEFRIREASVTYEDHQGDMTASLAGLNFLLRGKWSGSSGTLFTETTIIAVNVVMEKIRYLRDAQMRFTATLDADPEQGLYTFRENEFALNDLTLGFDGTVSMPGDSIDVNIGFATRKTSFKSLLSMIPAIYMNDFADLKTAGSLSLDGKVRGIYYAKEGDTLYPNASLNLQVNNASFAYPDLPEQVKAVNIDVKVLADGTHPDNTTIDVNRFSWKIGENPFRADLHIKHPVSDPDVKGSMNGRIDLGTLNNALALDSTEMAGLITADLKIAGRMSMIEKEQYEDFTADGSVKVKDISVVTPMMKDKVEIPQGTMLFSPRYVDLQGLKIIIGPSDMAFSGKLEQFIPYVFDKGTVKGTLTFNSHYLDLNRLMPVETTEETAADTLPADTLVADTAAVGVPANIDFLLAARMDKVIYGNLTATGAGGTIRVKDQKVFFDGLGMKAMGGTLSLNGLFSSARPGADSVAMNMAMAGVSIPEVYHSFVTVKKLLPFTKGLGGTVTTRFSFSSLLDASLMPVLSTLNAQGKVQSDKVTVVTAGVFEEIKKLLKINEAFTNEMKDLNLSFTIENGNLKVQPFRVKAGAVDMIISGEQGLDRSVNYLFDMKIPRKALGKEADQAITALYAKAAGLGLQAEPPEVIPVKARITGTLTHPKIGLDMKGTAGSSTQAVKEVVTQQVQEEVKKVEQQVEEKKEDLKTEADAQAEALLKEAAQKRDQAIAAAAQERDKILKKADEMEKNAKGTMLEKMQIKAEAKAMRKAANKAYEKAVKIANDQYKKAEQKAEEIRKKVKEM